MCSSQYHLINKQCVAALAQLSKHLWLGMLFWAATSAAQTWQGTKVELVASSFSVAERQGLQPVADHVAQLIDELIPGEPEDYPTGGIVVFEAPARWKSPAYAKHNDSPPIILSGLRAADEPPESARNTLRIALNEAPQPNYLSLAYQLAHELAHVKMGARTDNYLDETFAVATSLEVLRRLGYEGFMLSCEGYELQRMPLLPQQAIASDRWADVQAYWLAQSRGQDLRLDDRGFQMVGALLILRERKKLAWPSLLNAGENNVCYPTTPAHVFARCKPDLSRMRRQTSFLNPLGLRQRSILSSTSATDLTERPYRQQRR